MSKVHFVVWEQRFCWLVMIEKVDPLSAAEEFLLDFIGLVWGQSRQHNEMKKRDFCSFDKDSLFSPREAVGAAKASLRDAGFQGEFSVRLAGDREDFRARSYIDDAWKTL